MMVRVNKLTYECDLVDVPAFLRGLSEETLTDLSWTDDALGVTTYGWYTPVRRNIEFNTDTHYESSVKYTYVPQDDKVYSDPIITEIDQEVIAHNISDKKNRLYESIDSHRNSVILSGMPYAFPDDTQGTIQLRHERDILNVNAVGTAAMMMISAGDTSTKLDFRDQEDVTHKLTAPEMLAMAQDVMGWISAHYAAAWAHKDALKELVEAGDVEGVTAYDITQGWP